MSKFIWFKSVLKVVTGTDADLRKLSMAKLHKILA